jgi:hypothetical protein
MKLSPGVVRDLKVNTNLSNRSAYGLVMGMNFTFSAKSKDSVNTGTRP